MSSPTSKSKLLQEQGPSTHSTGELAPELVALVEWTMERAKAAGAEQVAASVGQSRFVELEHRNGELERVRASESHGLSIALYLEGRYSAGSTSYLEKGALERFIQESVVMTRALARDPHRQLPDPSLYGPAMDAELDLWDASQVAPPISERKALLARMEQAVRQGGPAGAMGWPLEVQPAELISVKASCTSRASASVQIHSNGFYGELAQTGGYVGIVATVRGETEKRPEDHASAGACHFGDLPSAETLGYEAAARALTRVGARQLTSGPAFVLVESRAAGRLLGSLLAPLTGHALQQKRSFLATHQDQEVGSPLLDLADQPLLPRGLGSRTFDGEGLAAKTLPLFERGVLKNYLIDAYHGRKLSRAPTSGSTSNLVLTPGASTRADLLSRIPQGVLVTGFLGGNANPATGDFSYGIVGYAISQGQLTHAVSEMNITGNHLQLWKRLVAVGDDPNPHSSRKIPSLLFDGVQLAGR